MKEFVYTLLSLTLYSIYKGFITCENRADSDQPIWINNVCSCDNSHNAQSYGLILGMGSNTEISIRIFIRHIRIFEFYLTFFRVQLIYPQTQCLNFHTIRNMLHLVSIIKSVFAVHFSSYVQIEKISLNRNPFCLLLFTDIILY